MITRLAMASHMPELKTKRMTPTRIMKRPILLPFFILLSAQIAQTQVVNTERVIQPQNATVKGPVKSIRISSYLNMGDQDAVVKYNEFPLFDFRYDEAGNLLEEVRYETDGHPYQKTTYERSADGLLQKSVETDLDNNRQAITTYSPDGSFQVAYLDTAGNIQEFQEVHFNPGEKTELFRKTDGSIAWGIKYKLDEHGNAIQQKEFFDEEEMNAEDGYELIHRYTYNASGQVTEQLSLDDGEFVGKEVFIYDGLGHLVETTFFYQQPGKLSFQKTYRYNDHGDVSEWTWDNKESYAIFFQKTNYEYVYDGFGNWILRHSLKDGFSGWTVERKMEYWKE